MLFAAIVLATTWYPHPLPPPCGAMESSPAELLLSAAEAINTPKQQGATSDDADNSIENDDDNDGNDGGSSGPNTPSGSLNGNGGTVRTKRKTAVHNSVEKKRRAQLSQCYKDLQGSIPSIAGIKASNANVLCTAKAYIEALQQEEQLLLRAKKISLQLVCISSHTWFHLCVVE